jgi:hypothetical protein
MVEDKSSFEKKNERKSKPTISPVEFIDRVIKRDGKGESLILSPDLREHVVNAPSVEIKPRLSYLQGKQSLKIIGALAIVCVRGAPGQASVR